MNKRIFQDKLALIIYSLILILTITYIALTFVDLFSVYGIKFNFYFIKDDYTGFKNSPIALINLFFVQIVLIILIITIFLNLFKKTKLSIYTLIICLPFQTFILISSLILFPVIKYENPNYVNVIKLNTPVIVGLSMTMILSLLLNVTLILYIVISSSKFKKIKRIESE